jgi:hypothetical protein
MTNIYIERLESGEYLPSRLALLGVDEPRRAAPIRLPALEEVSSVLRSWGVAAQEITRALADLQAKRSAEINDCAA